MWYKIIYSQTDIIFQILKLLLTILYCLPYLTFFKLQIVLEKWIFVPQF